MNILAAFVLEDLLLCLIIFIPALLAIIASKTWNIVHGIVTFLFTSYIIVLLGDFGLIEKMVGASASFNSFSTDAVMTGALWPVTYISSFITGIDGLSSVFDTVNPHYVMIAIYGVLFLLSQVVSQILRKKRK